MPTQFENPLLHSLRTTDDGEEKEYFFIDLEGKVGLRRRQVRVAQRDGKPGARVVLGGIHGVQFQLRSHNFVAHWEQARDALDAYHALKEIVLPPIITQNGHNYGRFALLDIEEVERTPVVSTCGGLPDGYPWEIYQECVWTFQG